MVKLMRTGNFFLKTECNGHFGDFSHVEQKTLAEKEQMDKKHVCDGHRKNYIQGSGVWSEIGKPFRP